MEQAFSMHQTNAFKMFLFAMDNQYATYCNVTYCFLIHDGTSYISKLPPKCYC